MFSNACLYHGAIVTSSGSDSRGVMPPGGQYRPRSGRAFNSCYAMAPAAVIGTISFADRGSPNVIRLNVPQTYGVDALGGIRQDPDSVESGNTLTCVPGGVSLVNPYQ